MAIPFRLPQYDEDYDESYHRVQRLARELRIRCRVSFTIRVEYVVCNSMPGALLVFTLVPYIPLEASMTSSPAPTYESANIEPAPIDSENNMTDHAGCLKEDGSKSDMNDPEGGTT